MFDEVQKAAWQRYRAERSTFVDAAREMEGLLAAASRKAGVRAIIAARAKETASFAKKIITKNYDDPWTQITDKIGARIVVDEPSDTHRVFEGLTAAGVTMLTDIDDKGQSAPVDKLGYLGKHCQLQVPDVRDSQGAHLECELQVRTRVEDAWAVAEHRLNYKGVVKPDRATQRRIMRLVALVELFDNELEAAVQDIKNTPGYEPLRLLRSAEAVYLDYVMERGNDDLSLSVLHEVLNAAPLDDPNYETTLADFSERNHDTLRSVYDRYLDVDEPDGRYLLLSQPESVVLFERIETKGYMLASNLNGNDYESLIRPLYTLWGKDWPAS